MSGLILPYNGILPTIAKDAFIAPNATVIGQVTIGEGASIWFNTVLRGDVGTISVGARTNLQDGTIVHVTLGEYDTFIGDDVLVGHMAIIHGAHLEDRTFVGMGATILDGVVVESGAMVAAGALVTPGKRVKRGELWAGRPAKLMRKLSEDEIEGLTSGAAGYHALSREYLSGM
ncbi:MAG: gamma carbonic anhydrase family protein [Rhodospirillales bacterium]|nr:gamma carbonic anhydrase family protein [Rhodospirillales bacterium]